MNFTLKMLVLIAPLVAAAISAVGAWIWRTPVLRPLAPGYLIILTVYGTAAAGFFAFAYSTAWLEKRRTPMFWTGLTSVAVAVTAALAAFAACVATAISLFVR